MQNHTCNEAFKKIDQICSIDPDIGQKVSVAHSCHWVKIEKLSTHNARIHKIWQGARVALDEKRGQDCMCPEEGCVFSLLTGHLDTWAKVLQFVFLIFVVFFLP